MKRFRLLLLDANVVIHLFELGLWDRVVERCEVLLSRIVAEREAQFFEKDDGEKVYFDLHSYIADGRVTMVEASIAEIKAFRDRFDPVYLSRLDDGEAESLAILANSPEKHLICSADAIVFRVLALLGCVEQAISLEEILEAIGLRRRLDWGFTKGFRETWTEVGFQHGVRGLGLEGN